MSHLSNGWFENPGENLVSPKQQRREQYKKRKQMVVPPVQGMNLWLANYVGEGHVIVSSFFDPTTSQTDQEKK